MLQDGTIDADHGLAAPPSGGTPPPLTRQARRTAEILALANNGRLQPDTLVAFARSTAKVLMAS